MEFALLAGLDPDARTALLSAARRRSFGRDEVLFHEGDPADTLHLLRAGRCAVRKVTRSGRAITLRLMGPGDAIGELALLGVEARRTASVVAIEPSETLSVTAPSFAQVRAAHPSVNEFLITLLVDRVVDLSARLSEANASNADERIRRSIVELSALYGDGDGEGAVIPLAQEDIAELAGTTRVTVNRVLRQEQERGAVQLGRGKIVVTDLAAITKRARL